MIKPNIMAIFNTDMTILLKLSSFLSFKKQQHIFKKGNKLAKLAVLSFGL